MKDGWNQYAPMPGVLKLRERIAEKTLNCIKRQYDPYWRSLWYWVLRQGSILPSMHWYFPGEEVIIIEPVTTVICLPLNGWGNTRHQQNETGHSEAIQSTGQILSLKSMPRPG